MNAFLYMKLLNLFAKDVRENKVVKNTKIEIKPGIFCYYDSDNNFIEIFDNSNGYYIMSDVLNENFQLSGIDPLKRNAPNLLDIGIMKTCKSCKSCGVGCYQAAKNNNGSNMSLDLYKSIIDEVKDKVFSVALGGAGNVTDHENFKEILEYTVQNKIVPNFTISGLGLTQEHCDIIKKNCGAVAVSYHPLIKDGIVDYSDCQQYTKDAISLLLKNKIKTNLHFVLGKNSIKRAISFFKNKDYIKGLNAIIFLRYKPIGLGTIENILDINSKEAQEFFKYVNNPPFKNKIKIGFDSCTEPLLTKYCKNINDISIMPCESASFSAYIDADGNCMPCSFANNDKSFFVKDGILKAWNSEIFSNFRKHKCPWLGIKNE